MRLELRRGDLGTEARGFALVGHDDTRHGIHILFERHIPPDIAPKTHTDQRNDDATVFGLKQNKTLGIVIIADILVGGEHREDLLGGSFGFHAVGIEDEGFDLVVEIGQRPVELLRIFVGAVPERLENIALLLLQLVLRLTLLQRERSHGQQSRHDDDHDRRIDDDISVAVGIVHPALFPAGPILRKCRRGSLADGAGIGCGVTFVDMSANAAYEFFLCHISPILPI